MKVMFGDSSFLEFLPEDNNITLVLCGKKSLREVTMSSVELSEEQVSEIIDFLLVWKEAKK